MCFLRVLCFGLIETRVFRQVDCAVIPADQFACAIQRFFGQLHAIGSHVGNQTHGLAVDVHPFVQLLRHTHGVSGGEAQFTAGFLLHGRGGERRRWVLLALLLLDLQNAQAAGVFDDGFCGGRIGFVAE